MLAVWRMLRAGCSSRFFMHVRKDDCPLDGSAMKEGRCEGARGKDGPCLGAHSSFVLPAALPRSFVCRGGAEEMGLDGAIRFPESLATAGVKAEGLETVLEPGFRPPFLAARISFGFTSAPT